MMGSVGGPIQDICVSSHFVVEFCLFTYHLACYDLFYPQRAIRRESSPQRGLRSLERRGEPWLLGLCTERV